MTSDETSRFDPAEAERTNRVPVLTRSEFLTKFGREYGNGHVTFLGPTQRGKTYLSQQMLKEVISPARRCVILAGKPPGRDKLMETVATRLNLRVIEEWPPTYNVNDKKRNGFVLRPHHNMKGDGSDEKNLRDQFQRALNSQYRSKVPTITVADEAFQLQNELKLQKDFERILVRGAPISALWTLLQRGRFSSYFVYDMAEHILMASDPDLSNVTRYAQMVGGVSPQFVVKTMQSLKVKQVDTGNGSHVTVSEFLYIRRAGPEMCIVGID